MENQQQSSTPLCAAGCGFFGSSATEGLCSKCFKDNIKKKQDTGRASPNSVASAALEATFKAAVANAQTNIDEDLLKLNASPALSSSSSAASLAIETALAEASTEANTSESTAPIKAKPNRCQVCKRKVGLTGFPCRCGGLYCGEHRYDTAHDCQFDYKTMEREQIKLNNPMVKSEKIQKI